MFKFNVSALLLDDPLKPATPMTNGAINETLRHTLDISQGSIATYLRCGGCFIIIRSALPEKATDNAMKDYYKRLQVCVSANGGHFERLMS